VVQGHVQEGMHHLDEAMTMATSKEVGDFMVISEILDSIGNSKTREREPRKAGG